MNKKSCVLGILFILSLVVLVNAQGPSSIQIQNTVTEILDKATAAVEPITVWVLGETADVGDYPASAVLFAKLLFFIVILSVVFIALNQVDFFQDHPPAMWAIIIAVSVLAVRFISDSLIPTILLPYSTFGIALASGAPLILSFIVIEVLLGNARFKTLRKILWVLLAVVFVVLWIVRWDELGSSGRWIYLGTAIASIALLLLDGTIQGTLHRMKLDKVTSTSRSRLLLHYKRQIAEAANDVTQGVITPAEHDRIVNRARRMIVKYSK
jgi:hypothetical protein